MNVVNPETSNFKQIKLELTIDTQEELDAFKSGGINSLWNIPRLHHESIMQLFKLIYKAT